MPEMMDKAGHGAGDEEDFAALFEQSQRNPKQGDIVAGTVVAIGPDTVTVDIGYKSEGQIRRSEFTTREGELTVNEGDVVDVFYETNDQDTGEIILSRQKALQFSGRIGMMIAERPVKHQV